jgi:hypothetical protein
MSELFGDLFYPLAPAALTWCHGSRAFGALWESEFVLIASDEYRHTTAMDGRDDNGALQVRA